MAEWEKAPKFSGSTWEKAPIVSDSADNGGDKKLGPKTLDEYAKEVFGFKDYKYRGNILPFGEDDKGNKEFATPEILKNVATLALLPGHAARGGSYTPQETLGLAALISPMSAASRAGEHAIPTSKTTHKPMKPEVPTYKELRAAASKDYDKASSLGVDYSSSSIKDLADDIVRALEAEWRGTSIDKDLLDLVGQIRNPPRDSFASLSGLHALRKRLAALQQGQSATAATNPLGREQAASTGIAIEKLDRFLESRDPSRVVVKPAPATGTTSPVKSGYDFAPYDEVASNQIASDAADALKRARGNSAAAFRSGRLTGVGDVAELQAAASGGGHNLGNTIRQRLATFLQQPRKTSGLTKSEYDAIEAVVLGTATQNQLRDVSNLLGGGRGLGGALLGLVSGGLVGSATGNPVMGMLAGAAAPTTGAVARGMYNRSVSKGLKSVDELIRARSPLYQSRLANPPMAVQLPTEAILAEKLSAAAAAQHSKKKPVSLLDYEEYLRNGGA